MEVQACTCMFVVPCVSLFARGSLGGGIVCCLLSSYEQLGVSLAAQILTAHSISESQALPVKVLLPAVVGKGAGEEDCRDPIIVTCSLVQ